MRLTAASGTTFCATSIRSGIKRSAAGGDGVRREITGRESAQFTLGQCDNPVIDAFLYGRVQEAKSQGGTVETHIILPVELPVSNTDLVIVFGNLMDNAVEACAKLENPKIELNAHIEKGYLVITESNPAVPEPEGRKQRRIPALERGVGMQILKSVAEKYQGSCMSETGNGNYSASVFLMLGQAKEGNAIYAENSCV